MVSVPGSIHRMEGPDSVGPALLMPRPSQTDESRNLRGAIAEPKLLVCVDNSPQAHRVLAFARAIAPSLGLSVTLAGVVPVAHELLSPADPVAWQSQRRIEAERLARLAAFIGNGRHSDSIVLAGDPAMELARWSDDHGVTLLTLARNCGHARPELGTTARSLRDHAAQSLLLVPPGPATADVRFRKILVPLDGSALAESVLPVALRIARDHGAQLLLAHVVQRFMRPQPIQSQDLCELEFEIDRHSARRARSYLAQMRSRVGDKAIEVRTAVLGPGDPRTALAELALKERADLIVMSAQGVTNMNDVRCGSVAEYLIDQTNTALLVIRPNLTCSFSLEASSDAKVPAHLIA